MNLIVYSGLQHLKLDFVSVCCHSDWSQNIQFYLLFIYHDQLHKPVQLETQLKTAPWHTFLSLRWTIPEILTDRDKASIRFANKKKFPTIMMAVLQDRISNCTQSLGLGKMSACGQLERKTAFREHLCPAALPVPHSAWWELWERGARKLGPRGWLEPGLALGCAAVSCKAVPNCTRHFSQAPLGVLGHSQGEHLPGDLKTLKLFV